MLLLQRFSLTRALQGFFPNSQMCFWWIQSSVSDNSLERVLNESKLRKQICIRLTFILFEEVLKSTELLL